MTRRKHTPKPVQPKLFPASALLDWLGCESDNQTAEILGMGLGSTARWRNNNQMFTTDQADRLACRLGVHPIEIWHDWYEVAEFVGV